MPHMKNEKNNTSSTYQQFFQAAARPMANENDISLTAQETIRQLEEYQEEINNYQQTRDKIKQLLDKGNLSPEGETKAISRLQLVEVTLAHHQAKLASLIESHLALQAHFRSQP